MLRRRLLLAAFVATLTLALAAGTAWSRRFEVSSTGFRIMWPELHAEFALGEPIPNVSIRCPVTVEGSFHSRTLSKVSGLLIGYVTRASMTEAACVGTTEAEGRSAKFQLLSAALPWHIRYGSFSGVLPAITQIHVFLIGFALRAYELPFGATCLYRSTATQAVGWKFVVSRSLLEPFNAEEAGPFTPFSEGSFLCDERVLVEGNGAVTQQGSSTTRISVRLIQ